MVSRPDAKVPASSFRQLIIRHCATLVERVDVLHGITSSFACAGGSKDQISEARAVAHQIAGAGASIGFDRLSDLAAALERMLDEVLEAAQPASREQLAELAVLAADLEREARHMKPEHSRLYNLDPAAVTRTGT
jgi:HPt (histidine-containing phosphotransfer) domain-containing protein